MSHGARTLDELMAQYLQRQAEAHAQGLGYAEAGDEVVPFDAIPAQPVDPKLAWDESCTAVRLLGATQERRTAKAPDDWSALVVSHEPMAALPLCLGNFPQLVRDVHVFYDNRDLHSLRAMPSRPLTAPGLAAWVESTTRSGTPAALLLAAGVLRLAREFDRAEALLRRCEHGLNAEWQAAWANEAAALAWHRGQFEDAAAMWRLQPASVPVLFNRGMADLFTGRVAEARTALREAVAQLPEDNAWHHLARLYLALAEEPSRARSAAE